MNREVSSEAIRLQIVMVVMSLQLLLCQLEILVD